VSRAPRVKADYKSKNYIGYVQRRCDLDYNKIAAIIKLYHQLAREDLALGEAIFLKQELGTLRPEKELRELDIKEDGTIINNLPINKAETFKLWRKKPELKGKTFIRYTNQHSDGYYYTLNWIRSHAKFKNKLIYNFQFNRKLKSMLSQNIIDKKTDAYAKRKF